MISAGEKKKVRRGLQYSKVCSRIVPLEAGESELTDI